MKRYVELFLIFSKIGLFTLGGGYAMIPLIEAEVVRKRGWINRGEFLDYLAISQSAPGILAINIAIFVGNKVKGTRGSIVAAIGTAVPSFVIILLIAIFFENFRENRYVSAAFTALRPAVVALIAVPLISLSKAANLNRYTSLLPIITVLLIVVMGLSPIWIILSSALLALFYHYLSLKNRIK